MKASYRKIKTTSAIGCEGKWISVKDFLPEPDLTVAVLTNTGKAMTAECSHKTTRASYSDGKWEIGRGSPFSSGLSSTFRSKATLLETCD